MASRAERSTTQPLAGPFAIGPEDVSPLNLLFSSAFTERYRRDGLVGVRVPPLNPAIWRYAIDGAGRGAMLWRDAAGDIAAFNLAHVSGAEGWMGPLAVREDRQGTGQGKAIVRAGIDHLVGASCRTIGLETMPRTVDNIGFYSGLGFIPGHLTVTLTVDAAAAPVPCSVLSTLTAADRDDSIAECAALTASLVPGADYSREIRLTHELSLGDTLLVRRAGAIVGFALCHAAPLVEGRSREELRVLKLAAADQDAFDTLLGPLASLARRSATARAALRVQGEHGSAFAAVMRAGGRVRWTDLRMTLDGYAQPEKASGIVFTNWEI
ncbi:MAG: GNAT family N-acetyltransferase [Gemmatimonadetes bacterium]|nr:GNAT family N-acetyltransferase [Gemmatimonadota bacterium]